MVMRYGILLGMLIGLSACDDTMVFEENKAIPSGHWPSTDAVIFDVVINDTIQRHDMFVNVRNGDAYAYSNLYLFVEINFPNGKRSVDTLECFLADPSGRWYGSGLGDMYDNRFLFKQNKSFPLPGQYRVSIQQAMRDDVLKEIYDIGFRVARTR